MKDLSSTSTQNGSRRREEADSTATSENVRLVTSAATGRHYWRSLDQLAETPEFKQFLEREFPAGASELTDPVSRRHFVKIMSASFMLAGLGLGTSGCRRPEDKLMPFGKAAENYTHGTSQYFATAMPARSGAIPRYAQASILNLYDPDRATRFAKWGGSNYMEVLETVQPEVARDALAQMAKKFAANQGKGLCILTERTNSPSRARLKELIHQGLPQAMWFVYEPVNCDTQRIAATTAFDDKIPLVHETWGHTRAPYYRLEKADCILSLDCDFIGSEEDSHRLIRDFARRRKPEKPGDGMSRLYAIESLFTLTGVNADHRLRVPASAVIQVAAAIAEEVARLTGGDASVFEKVGKPAEVNAKWIAECAKDLVANRGRAVVMAGYRQPLLVHQIALAMNAALGAVGQTVTLQQLSESDSQALLKDCALPLFSLVKGLNDGYVDTLVILNSNPVYNAPADLNWAAAQSKAKTVVRLGYYEDETGSACHWHFPLAHYLESWGDARASDGTLVPIQPLIAPLFGGLTELEFLARLGGLAETSPNKIVRETFGAITGDNSDGAWNKFLHDGFLAGSAAKAVNANFIAVALADALADKKIPALNKDNLEVVLHRDYSLDDGRYANNGWMQEFPDPITKITWDNAVLISRKTAQELGVKNSDVVEITLDGRTVKGPIWIQPGMADYSLGLALGYGRTKVGRVGVGTGFDAYPLFTTKTGYIATGATVRKTGETYPISCTQEHWSMEGRAIVREANLDQFAKHHDFAEKMNAPKAPSEEPMYPNPLDEAKKTALHQWGMSIDLSACVGCGTCVVACQSENNIPIVGKDLVQRGREMHWMRIDRYYASKPAKHKFSETFRKDEEQQFDEWIDDVQAVNQPMICQHCETAPCESVCPVNATVHDQEGLNVMVYNRCVGTRYCSNNCPYKVRRFNYLDYNKRPLSELKGPFYASPFTHRTGGEWDLLRWWKNQDSGMRAEDEWDLIRMIKNPDVTVRMRGVMEKCTFCVQRIEGAKIAQKVKAGASGDVVVPDGTIKTACQQACPAEAIVFGNVADPTSHVSRLKQQSRDYSVLDFLATKPRTTYLARVRNPNPAMPDYTEWPLTFGEFEKNNGPVDFEAHHGEVARGRKPAAEKGTH